MIYLNLAMKSLWSRKGLLLLAVMMIATSVFLVLIVQRLNQSVKDGFVSTISQTQLIVGSRTSPIQLLLNTVFHIGSPSQNISAKVAARIEKHPSVKWIIPLSLGDNHKGYRVVATDSRYFEFYRYRGGQSLAAKSGGLQLEHGKVVLGAEVAEELGYSLGQKIVVSHGVEDGFRHHDHHPFEISGILRPTGTPVDRLLYISLEDMAHVHDGHGAEEISAMYLGLNSKMDVLRVQREINESKDAALTAAIPGVTLQQLWQFTSIVERALQFLTWLVLLVSLLGIVLNLTSVSDQRRREMSIYRALGMGVKRIFALFVFEGFLLILLGGFIGATLYVGMSWMLSPMLSEKVGIHMDLSLQSGDVLYFIFILCVGVLMSLWPAFRAYRLALHDGLTPRI